jgi:uncharacterized membrane protein YciS (DUF1049 family)
LTVAAIVAVFAVGVLCGWMLAAILTINDRH